MAPDRRDAANLWDMLSAARKIADSVQGVTLAAYAANEELRLTVERRLEIIGEAARRLSAQFRQDHPGIPWRRIIAQRNFLAHEYDEIDDERIWRLAVEEMPRLVAWLESVVPSPTPDEPS
jgi:uncharacterized protein with HEPN domain